MTVLSTVLISSASTIILEHYGKILLSSLIKHYVYKGTKYIISKCYNGIKNKIFKKKEYINTTW